MHANVVIVVVVAVDRRVSSRKVTPTNKTQSKAETIKSHQGQNDTTKRKDMNNGQITTSAVWMVPGFN